MAAVNFIRPDGRSVTVDESEAEAAEARGYKRELSPNAKIASNQPITAFVESAGRGLVPGYGEFLQGFNEGIGEKPEMQKLREEQNPTAAFAGDVASMLVPIPGTKAGLIAKAGGLVKGKIASKVAGRVASGVVEGGLYGLSAAIDENSMTDSKLAGENIAAGTLGGALAGGVLSPVLGAGADLGRSALMKAFGGKALKDVLGGLAEKSVMRQISSYGDLGKGNLKERIPELGRFALDRELVKGFPSAGKVAERAGTLAENLRPELETALRHADSVGKFDPDPVAYRIDQELMQPLYNNPAAAGEREFFDKLSYDFLKIGKNSPQSFEKAEQVLQKMRANAKDRTNPEGIKGAWWKAREILHDEFFKQGNALQPGLGDELYRVNREYGNAAKISELATKAADREFQNRLASHTDYLAAAAGFVHGGVGGLALGAVNRLARTRGGFAIGSALDSLANMKTLPRVVNGFQKFIQNKLTTTPTFGGTFRAVLENASARGAMDLLETHMSLANNPEYQAATGLQIEPPESFPDHADKAHRLALLADSTERGQDEIDKSVARMLGQQPGRAPNRAEREATRQNYEGLVDTLKKLQSDSSVISKQLSEIAPATAGIAAMSVVNAANFLLEKAPKNPYEGLPPALQRSWEPSKADLRTWFRYVDAVADPRVIIENARHGTVTPEALEALRAIYPRLLQEFQEKAKARLSTLKQPMDRKTRAQVSVLTGDLEDPQIAQMIQAAHTQASPPNPGKKPDARQDVSADKNMQTQAQRLEGKQGSP